MHNLSLCNTCLSRHKITLGFADEGFKKSICTVSGTDTEFPVKQCCYFDLDENMFEQHLEYLRHCYDKRKK